MMQIRNDSSEDLRIKHLLQSSKLLLSNVLYASITVVCLICCSQQTNSFCGNFNLQLND